MSLISRLSVGYTPPKYAKAFKNFTRGAIAKEMNLSYGHVSNVLSGCRNPSPEVEGMFIALAKRLEAEMAEQQGV